jgi:hypothetical protein
MKTITISLYNRPDYTKILFDHLNRCDGIEEYATVICCEPVNDEVIEIAKKFRPEKSYLIINNKKLGCNWNIFQCLNIGFDNSNFHIHLEDDTIPGKDFLRYCEWGKTEYENNLDIFCISGYVNVNNHTEHYFPRSDDINLICRRNWFTPWGWASWKDRWDAVKVNLFNKLKRQPSFSWDCHLHNLIREKYEIFPAVSRIQNIGANNGTYVPNATWHKNNQYNEFWIETIGSYTNHFIEKQIL